MLDSAMEKLRYSRSARDISELARTYPDIAANLKEQRPALASIPKGIDALEAALDAERRQMIRADERRLAAYMEASEKWRAVWPEVSTAIKNKPLAAAHLEIVLNAESILPFSVPESIS